MSRPWAKVGMTRQPSTRTAEPRTAAGRRLLADLTMGYDPEKGAETGDVVMPAVYEGMTRDILAIEAEAAAPAGLDVEALALVFAGITFSEWADAQGDTTRLFDLTRHVAAEYARLLRQRGER